MSAIHYSSYCLSLCVRSELYWLFIMQYLFTSLFYTIAAFLIQYLLLHNLWLHSIKVSITTSICVKLMWNNNDCSYFFLFVLSGFDYWDPFKSEYHFFLNNWLLNMSFIHRFARLSCTLLTYSLYFLL